MNLSEIERSLRRPHPIETTYSTQGPASQRRVTFRAGLRGTHIAVVAVIAIAAAAVALPNLGHVGAGPEASNPPSGEPAPSKPFVSIAPDVSPPGAISAPCGPGAVKGSLIGWGGAMGTQYALIRLDPLGAICSLPRTPAVILADDAGATLGSSSVRPAGPRVDLTPSALEVRVGVASLCGLTAKRSAIAVVDFGNQGSVRVPLPAEFRQVCAGGVSSVSVDELSPVQ